MNLLSINDCKYLHNAMLQHEEVVLERQLNGWKVTARTLRVSEPWQVDMIVQLQQEFRNIFTIQNFTTAEAARKACER